MDHVAQNVSGVGAGTETIDSIEKRVRDAYTRSEDGQYELAAIIYDVVTTCAWAREGKYSSKGSFLEAVLGDRGKRTAERLYVAYETCARVAQESGTSPRELWDALPYSTWAYLGMTPAEHYRLGLELAMRGASQRKLDKAIKEERARADHEAPTAGETQANGSDANETASPGTETRPLVLERETQEVVEVRFKDVVGKLRAVGWRDDETSDIAPTPICELEHRGGYASIDFGNGHSLLVALDIRQGTLYGLKCKLESGYVPHAATRRKRARARHG